MIIIAVTFEIGGSDRDPKTPNNEEEPEWECVWKCHTATQVHHMSFSPDGTLFATSGKSDRLVKIWYENKHGMFGIHPFPQHFFNNSFDDLHSPFQCCFRTKMLIMLISVRWHQPVILI